MVLYPQPSFFTEISPAFITFLTIVLSSDLKTSGDFKLWMTIHPGWAERHAYADGNPGIEMCWITGHQISSDHSLENYLPGQPHIHDGQKWSKPMAFRRFHAFPVTIWYNFPKKKAMNHPLISTDLHLFSWWDIFPTCDLSRIKWIRRHEQLVLWWSHWPMGISTWIFHGQQLAEIWEHLKMRFEWSKIDGHRWSMT